MSLPSSAQSLVINQTPTNFVGTPTKPHPDVTAKVNEVLSKTCTQVCVEELSLQADHDFVVKVVQFQELLDVRHR